MTDVNEDWEPSELHLLKYELEYINLGLRVQRQDFEKLESQVCEMKETIQALRKEIKIHDRIWRTLERVDGQHMLYIIRLEEHLNVNVEDD